MPTYLSCIQCGKKMSRPYKTCSQTCSKAFKRTQDRAAKARQREDSKPGNQAPTWHLTDEECLLIEAALSENNIRPVDSATELYEASPEITDHWANKGAELDIWEIRHKDRARFGGFVHG